MKLGIVGTGNVGCAIALAAVTRGSAREIVLVNRTRKTAEAVATDLRYGTPLSPKVDIRDGDYADLAGAGVVLITSGVNEKTGGATDRNDPQGRLKLLDKNAAIYRDVVPRIVSAAPEAVLVAVTDPPDPLADGTAQVFLWSSARIAGVPAAHLLARRGEKLAEVRARLEKDVRYANITIIEGHDASQYGIGIVSARIAEIVLGDEHAAIPIGSYQRAFGVTLSLPSVVGRAGVVSVLEPELSEEERSGLEKSAQTLRAALERVGS
jgi:L-lactate dehydrogenase